jgi:hypothetical protein
VDLLYSKVIGKNVSMPKNENTLGNNAADGDHLSPIPPRPDSIAVPVNKTAADGSCINEAALELNMSCIRIVKLLSIGTAVLGCTANIAWAVRPRSGINKAGKPLAQPGRGSWGYLVGRVQPQPKRAANAIASVYLIRILYAEGWGHPAKGAVINLLSHVGLWQFGPPAARPGQYVVARVFCVGHPLRSYAWAAPAPLPKILAEAPISKATALKVIPAIRLVAQLPVDKSGNPVPVRLPKAEMTRMLASKNFYLWAMAMWDKESLASQKDANYMFSLFTPQKSSIRRAAWMDRLIHNVLPPADRRRYDVCSMASQYIALLAREPGICKKH